MCISLNDSKMIIKDYNFKDFKFQYDSVTIHFLKNDFINFLQEKKIKFDKFKELSVTVFVYNNYLKEDQKKFDKRTNFDDVMAKNKIKNFNDEVLNFDIINKIIDNTFLLINWEYILKNKIVEDIKIIINIE